MGATARRRQGRGWGRTWRALGHTALAALLPLALLAAPAAAAPPPGGSGILAPTANTQGDDLPAPSVVSPTPHDGVGGQILKATLKDSAGGLTSADARLKVNGRVRYRFTGLSLTRAGGDTWTFSLTLPNVSDPTNARLRVRVFDASGRGSPWSGTYDLTIDPPPPVNQLPEAPYAAVFPAALLAAFALVRRRRAA